MLITGEYAADRRTPCLGDRGAVATSRRVDARPSTATRTHLEVQAMIADLAATLTTVEPDRIDDAIRDGLGRVGEALQLDQAMLWQTTGGEAGEASHCWNRNPHRLRPEPPQTELTPLAAGTLLTGESSFFTRLDELDNPVDRGTFLRQGIKSAAMFPVPLAAGAGESAGLAFSSSTREYDWTPAIIEQLRVASAVFGQALVRKASHEALQRALDELQQLREPAPANAECRQSRVRGLSGSRLIVSGSRAIREALAQAEQVAPTPATVLLLGETGVGKEVFAHAIHERSPRGKRPMIRVNCGAIPGALIESELFGRERGAYTGAVARQIGRFEAANMSTIFLDEIGELPAEVQVKLLGVLQERIVERLGSSQPIKVDVRIIAATNRNLEKAVEDKSFREDLFYRLNVFPIVVPPLRERIEDIPALAWEFVDEFSRSFGKPIESIARESVRELAQYSWPGNVRELRNVIERAVILATGPHLTVPMPQQCVDREVQKPTTLASFEADHIRATLDATSWRIRGAAGAAERLGLKPTTLESRMAKLGLVRPLR
jgi:formate hydrogenlyase transcriptional activator